MDWLWTWGGTFFGYKLDDGLFTYNGLQIGRFDGVEIYGRDGRYLGEIESGDRLITNSLKKSWMRSGFVPRIAGSYMPFVNYVGYVMYVGYEDFPDPLDFD